MNKPSSFLTEQIELLVRHFGVKRVQGAIAKFKLQSEEQPPQAAGRKDVARSQRPIRANGASAIDSIRQGSPEKHSMLSEFLIRLKDRRVLPESQDIRYFAQEIGLKEISGKSREDMIPKLMRFLMEQPVEKLRSEIEAASNISEQQRQMGFSVLTDKLLRTR
jgi:hypothetical protein